MVWLISERMGGTLSPIVQRPSVTMASGSSCADAPGETDGDSALDAVQ